MHTLLRCGKSLYDRYYEVDFFRAPRRFQYFLWLLVLCWRNSATFCFIGDPLSREKHSQSRYEFSQKKNFGLDAFYARMSRFWRILRNSSPLQTRDGKKTLNLAANRSWKNIGEGFFYLIAASHVVTGRCT